MRLFQCLSLATILLIAGGCSQDAVIKETTRTMTTYPYSDPDPVINPNTQFYPYYQFEGYSELPEQKEWKVIEMENQYIKLYIFPAIGGKIWGAVEKSTGKDFIYFNDAVKFRHVAMRGPWTSGGIEFNYGVIGHAPTTAGLIDYTMRTNKDGSVSCFVGARELITDTDWCVEVKLERDKAYFTTETYWENTVPLTQPYYHWMNAGYAATEDLRFCFPGTHYVGHLGELQKWPVDPQGHQLGEYAENNFGEYKSYHVLGEYSNFYGAYWKNSDFGSVHHSAYDDKLGMKIWVWGLSRQGMIWENLLTDNAGQYVELQSGRQYNQPATGSLYSTYKHFSFPAYATDRWKEYWYPVKSTKGIVASNAYGALNLERKDDLLKLYFSPVQALDAPIKVMVEGETIYSGHIKSEAMTTWSDSLKLEDSGALVKVVLGDALLVYSEVPADKELSRPLSMPENYDWNSLYGLYTQGREWMNIRHFDKAEGFLEQCLAIDSLYAPALNDMAELAYRRTHYTEAIAYARKSMSLNAYDPAANMIYGLAHGKKGEMTDAKDGFSVASYTPAYRAAAYVELSKVFAREHNWSKVLEYAVKSSEFQPENRTALQLQLMALRARGESEKAIQLADEWLQKLPLSHIIRFEKLLASKQEQKSNEFLSFITNELPYETLLAMGDWYESFDAYDEALKVLSYAPPYPMITYREAYLLEKSGRHQEAMTKVAEAPALSPELVTPHGVETLEALRWAAQQQNQFPTLYYLALAEWSIGDKERALSLLEQCGNRVAFSPFYLCRALLKTDEAQWADFQLAEKLEKSWRVGLRLINYTFDHGQYDATYAYTQEYMKLYPEKFQFGLKYAQILITQKRYTECVDFLRKLQVLPTEGSLVGRYIYRDACLMQAVDLAKSGDYDKALEWIENSKNWLENLGVGKPYDADIDLRAEHYITAYCLAGKGQKNEAREMLAKVAGSKQFGSPNALLTAWAYRYLGNSTAAREALATYGRRATPNRYSYVEAAFNNNLTLARYSLTRAKTIAQEAAWEGPQYDNAYDMNVVEAITEQLTHPRF